MRIKMANNAAVLQLRSQSTQSLIPQTSNVNVFHSVFETFNEHEF